MPMPARDLWSKIQKELRGRSQAEQLRVLQGHLAALSEEWKGPYKDLRDRLRRLVRRLESHESVRSRGGQTDPFHVRRQGDAQVAFIGLPNSGKSALVRALTGAATAVADFPFATQHPVPGMLACPGGAVQLVDTPAVVPGLAAGAGAGRPLLHLIANADALGLVVDLAREPVAQVEAVAAELAEASLHPVPGPVGTVFHARGKDGVKIRGRPLAKEEVAVARRLVADAHFEHGEVMVRTSFCQEELRAQLEGETLLPAVVLATHPDAVAADQAFARLRAGFPAHRVLAVDPLRPQALAPVAGALLCALGLIAVAVLDRPAPDAGSTDLLVPLASDVAAVAERAGGVRAGRVARPGSRRPGSRRPDGR